ncbi:MAG TPA: enoyl-CoA hydratase/isomerase family protein [Caulobacteraceae bacterium]|jgi:enoyl-CoA hydratase/carnithine racemase|nr:enoyl-CoA hydratase/isomerase family protein [Caulobacteraceae bacterium]
MSHIRVDREGIVATVTLDRAERRNAITAEMMADLERIARDFADDEATRAVIVRADGRDFSVGADLAAPPSARPEASLLTRRRAAEGGMRLMQALQDIPQPTIAAVQGVATGAGACIASACDFRIGATSARIGYGEVKLGMNLMWNAAPLCLRLVGLSRAKRMIMSGQLFDAASLERWGFLDEIAEPSQLDSAARAMADGYAALPPVAVRMVKRSLDHLAGALDRAVMHMDADQWLLATSSHDYREAVGAFFEKRPPDFKGD